MNPSPLADLAVATWRKSTRSTGGGSNCVEVARLPHHIAVRDTKDRTGPVLRFTPDMWQRFAQQMKRSLTRARHQGRRRRAHSGTHARVMAAMRRIAPGSQRS